MQVLALLFLRYVQRFAASGKISTGLQQCDLREQP
jgi:hypothetical protein